MSTALTPDYLIIGHVARDIVPDGAILGGTCSYAALTAHKLGKRTAAVTSYGPDIPSLAPLAGIAIKNVPHDHSTTFQNIYHAGVRTQKWLATSQLLSVDHVPAAWRSAPIVHLAALTQEISPAMCADFPDSLVCATGQGWLRGQDAHKTVIFETHPELENWLACLDVLILSLNDVFGDQAVLTELLTRAKLGVETMGPAGCQVFHRGRISHVPVTPEVELDPTGAGDIFAAAFFIRFQESGDHIEAAQFANACASLSVRKVGLEGTPSLAEVEAQRAKLYGWKARR